MQQYRAQPLYIIALMAKERKKEREIKKMQESKIKIYLGLHIGLYRQIGLNSSQKLYIK